MDIANKYLDLACDLKNILNNEQFRVIYPPIAAIDGVRVHCTMYIKEDIIDTHDALQDITLIFDVYNPMQYNLIYEGDVMMPITSLKQIISVSKHNKTEDISLEQIVSLIKDIIRQIRELKYNRMSGFNDTRQYKMMDIFNLPNTTLEGDKCCVCKLYTTNNTNCGHSLCLQCWAKLPIIYGKENEDDYVKSKGSICPMCSIFIQMWYLTEVP